jgi:serine protease Do
MNRRYTIVTVALVATTAFLIGLLLAGSFAPVTVETIPAPAARVVRAPADPPLPLATGTVNFADVAERLNPAVVNIDASGRAARRRSSRRVDPELRPDRFGGDAPRRGAGSGFLIDADGFILTNHHVVDGAERITVKLSDGRSFRAAVIGADPPTDIALLKIDAPDKLAFATLGDSGALRVGEWVCAIGNPLAYEHTVTVGVVSYIGRKLFDSSLDQYIQTDAAINYGNSGGPLINARGEVIGINSAISWRASNIGFAVPINQARAVLPQLKTAGRVARGYIGVTLTDLDPDLSESLRLGASQGALVMEVEDGSPGDRAGLRPYDLILAVDEEDVRTNDALIQTIAAREPGSVARLRFLRDGQERTAHVKLSERPGADAEAGALTTPPAPASSRDNGERTIGISVGDLTDLLSRRLRLPSGVDGVVVSHVDPFGPAEEAGVLRGSVLMEINRQPVATPADYRRILASARPGDVLALYLFQPSSGSRTLVTVRVEDD